MPIHEEIETVAYTLYDTEEVTDDQNWTRLFSRPQTLQKGLNRTNLRQSRQLDNLNHVFEIHAVSCGFIYDGKLATPFGLPRIWDKTILDFYVCDKRVLVAPAFLIVSPACLEHCTVWQENLPAGNSLPLLEQPIVIPPLGLFHAELMLARGFEKPKKNLDVFVTLTGLLTRPLV